MATATPKPLSSLPALPAHRPRRPSAAGRCEIHRHLFDLSAHERARENEVWHCSLLWAKVHGYVTEENAPSCS